MAYQQVGYGSKGNDVRKLQEILNTSGYNLAVDGEFGAKTQAAVRDYQTKHNLTVDGIVGVNTWGSLTSGSGNKASTPSTPQQSTTGQNKSNLPGISDYTAKNLSKYEQGYQPSETVKKAQAYLDQVSGQKPSPFVSSYEEKLNDIYEKIMNRKDFSYDLNGDMLYQQMKDQYQVLGKTAMQDTMGQAAALTGGYGNTYAQNVGQQAYNEHLRQLNDNIPELYQLALARYNQEGENMMKKYELTGDRYNDEYAKWTDDFNRWLAERDYASGRYDSERDFDYGDFSNMLSYWQSQAGAENQNYWNQKDFDFQREQFEYQKQQDALNYQLAKQKAASSGGGSTGGSGKSSSGNSSKTAEAYLKSVKAAASGIYATAKATRKNSQQAYNAVKSYLDNEVLRGTMTSAEAIEILKQYQ